MSIHSPHSLYEDLLEFRLSVIFANFSLSTKKIYHQKKIKIVNPYQVLQRPYTWAPMDHVGVRQFVQMNSNGIHLSTIVAKLDQIRKLATTQQPLNQFAESYTFCSNAYR